MKKDKSEEFRQILQEQMDQLLCVAGKTVSELTDEKTNPPDSVDLASLESERNFELRIRDRERNWFPRSVRHLIVLSQVDSVSVKIVVTRSAKRV